MKSTASEPGLTVFSVFSLFSPESETTSPTLIVSFLLCFFTCLIVSISFRLFGCFFFFNSKNNWKHNPRILLCYFTSLVLSARFLNIFFLNENVHVICCWKLGEFKLGDSLINEGIQPKAGKRKPRRWPGNPLKYKVQSKGQQWVNSSVWNLSYKLLFFSTLKNWHFLSSAMTFS